MVNKLEVFCREAENAGFRITPVFADGKSMPYGNGQTYPYRDYHEHWSKAVSVGVVLDDHLLLDWDGNKEIEGVPSLEELQETVGETLPIPVQWNAAHTSVHYLYRLPKDRDKSNFYQSQDGQFLKGVDLKTGNQLMHLKPVASDGSSKCHHWPSLKNVPAAPKNLIDAMRKKVIKSNAVPYSKFSGVADTGTLVAFKKDVEEFAELQEGQGGGRNNRLNDLTLKWLSIAYSGDIDPDMVEMELRAAAEHNGCEGVAATITSAKKKASTQPRHFRTGKSAAELFGRSVESNAAGDYFSTKYMPLSSFDIEEGYLMQGEDLADALVLLKSAFNNQLRVKDEKFYWWTGRDWAVVEDSLVRQKIGFPLLNGSKKAMQTRVKATVEAMRDHAERLPELDPPEPRIFFLNGVLLIPSGEFVDHSSDFFNTRTLAVEYDPQAKSSYWLKWLEGLFGNEASRVTFLQEIIGWLLTRDHFGIEKALLFLGPPRAGKGVISRILEAILGKGAVSFRLAELDDKKTLSAMRGKNVAIDHDAVSAQKRNARLVMGLFKCITSNDQVNLPMLYKQDPWEGRLGCKLLTLANSVPMMWDDSAATANRWLPLRFDQSFLDKEDPNLFRQLSEELPGIVAWGVEGLIRLVNRGRFELPESSREMLDVMVSDGGTIQDFIEECLNVGQEYRCRGETVWQSYRIWAMHNGYQIGTRKNIMKSVEDALQGQGVRRSKAVKLKNGPTVRGFYGVSVKEINVPENVTSLVAN